MIEIRLNDDVITLEEGATVAQVFERYAGDPFAVVAVNDRFVPKNDYAVKVLTNGDRLELLSPMEGG